MKFSSQASHAGAEAVWVWLHRTWIPSTGGTWCQINPGFSRPLPWSYLQPTFQKAQPSQHLLLSGHLGHHRSPASQFSRTCTGPKLSPPQTFTGDTNKSLYMCWKFCIVCQIVYLSIVSDKSICCIASTKTPQQRGDAVPGDREAARKSPYLLSSAAFTSSFLS